MTLIEAISMTAAALARSGLTDPHRDARLLVQAAVGRDAAFTYAHPEYELSREEAGQLGEWLAQRSQRVPIQQILGRQEFFGLEFDIDRNVLIPRPETEIIAERAIELLLPLERARFCEVGIGSGCIAVSVLKYVPHATAIGVDISDAALKVADHNARKHGVRERLMLARTSIFEAIDETGFDAVLSNPPYVSLDEYNELSTEVRRYEPRGALTDEGDGLAIIRRIVTDSRHKLRPGGVLLMEFGFGQSESVKELFGDADWSAVDVVSDLAGIPRTVVATRRHEC